MQRLDEINKTEMPVLLMRGRKHRGRGTVMISNVVDLTGALTKMSADRLAVTPELVAPISPCTREHILRFGRYVLDMDDVPSPLESAL